MRFVTEERYCFLVGRHDGHKKPLLNASFAKIYSALIPTEDQKESSRPRLPRCGRKFGQATWRELLQDKAVPGEGKGASVLCLRSEGKELLLLPSLLCSPARNCREDVLVVLMTLTPSPFVFFTVSILNILSQVKVNSAFRATGGRQGRLSLQSAMRCLQLPPLPGDWVSSASPTSCGGALHLLEFKKNPKHYSGCKGRRHFRDLGS